jgi:hypothetical protein
MINRSLDIYLNDHLAGSVVAIQLLEYLATVCAGTHFEKDINTLLNDILADRHDLEELMKLLGSGESTVRKASAWMSEKFAQVKLLFDDPKGGSFRLFEGMEAVSLGILGKRSLWQTLSTLAEISPELRVREYARLIQRAEQQHARAEVIRMDAAKNALIINGS